MRLLLCCEFYFPSVGGVQEVMRQIAERLVRRGHDVTVATSRLANREFTSHNGVKIEEFGVMGNQVRGMVGELEQYREFVASFDCDAIMIKAAQQWTFDALWPILDQISSRKVFIPCGFSGLFEPSYCWYFEELPHILRKFDHLIFYAENYRDIDFARQHCIESFSILANGACEIEFGVEKDSDFRRAHGIPEESVLLLTVGTLTGVKGHRELAEAFARLDTKRRHVTFIMNGNSPPKPSVSYMPCKTSSDSISASALEVSSPVLAVTHPPLFVRVVRVFKQEGLSGIKGRLFKRLIPFAYIFSSIHRTWVDGGLRAIRMQVKKRLINQLERYGLLKFMPPSLRVSSNPLAFWMEEAQRDSTQKLLIVSDYQRDELVQAYMAADLFVFASNIEYSPLVLFESVAAGTPFLSVPVGNADEIVRWTGGGIICSAEKDDRGYTRANPIVLAQEIAKAIENPERLVALGNAGHDAWRERYTWDAITTQYEDILRGTSESVAQGKSSCKAV